jgi:hypothetical protein
VGRSKRRAPSPAAPSLPSPLEGLGARLAGSGAPQSTRPRRGRRAAAALAVILLALLFVLPLGRESDIGVASPTPSPSVESSVKPSVAPSPSVVPTPTTTPTATPTPESPSPTVAPSTSQTTTPTGSPNVIGSCSSDVRIALASEWANSRFIVRTISIALPTAECDGASAQVLLLDAVGGLLLRRDGIIASQELIFNVLAAEIPSQSVQGTAIEITAPTTIPGESPNVSPGPSAETGALSIEIIGHLGSLIEEVQVAALGDGLVARSRIQLQILTQDFSSLVGDDGRGAIRQGVDERAPGAFVITAIGEMPTGLVQRRAYIALDDDSRVVILIRDYDAWLLVNGANAVPDLPVSGRGATILVAEDDRVVYLDERVSVNAWAAQLGNAAMTLTRPSTLLGGILTGILVALLGLVAGLGIDFIKRRIRQYFEGALERFKLPDLGSYFPKLLGFRIDVLPFLLVGQVVAALNAPLEKIPPLVQLLQGAALGALGILLVSEFTRIPRTQYMRRTRGDAGVFHGRWTSILLALIALGLSHLLNIVPGILVGLFAARRFRLELDDEEDAEVTWRTSLLQAVAAVVAWFAIDLITTQVPNPESALRAISDGILSTIVVIGSHGLLASMVNPTDGGAVALRRKSLWRWLALIVISSILVIGVISTGGSAEDLFGPGVSLPQLVTLTVIAVLLAAVAAAVTRNRRGADAEA